MQDSFRIGIDVGGTNTDAVLMSERNVVTYTKNKTSENVTAGVVEAMRMVIAKAEIDKNNIHAVMVGTTHFVNAFVQRKELTEVAIVRIGLPMTSGIPPLVDWPEDLRQTLGQHTFMIAGGSYYTGVDYIPLDEAALESAAQEIKKRGLKSVAISAVFSPIRPDLEERAAKIIKSISPDVSITLSYTVGGMGLIERENAAIINATLQHLAKNVVSALQTALEELNLTAQLYFSQNDGTLMSAESAIEFPVMTCSAGPTNSIRGAAFLTNLDDAIVVDVGGTTSDIGVLLKGFPRETIDAFEIGGVRTNFSIPDVLSIALGGGTIVSFDENNTVKLGPESVGFQLTEKSLAFGGDTLTTSDIAILRGSMTLGDASLVKNIDMDKGAQISSAIHNLIANAVDKLKISAEPVPVILVGGGSVLVDSKLSGASEIIKPEHGTVANAIGTAIAQVGGRVKKLYDFGGEDGRDAAIEQAVNEAKANAVAEGALVDSIKVISIEEYPMTHIQTNSVDVRVRVSGELDLSSLRK